MVMLVIDIFSSYGVIRDIFQAAFTNEIDLIWSENEMPIGIRIYFIISNLLYTQLQLMLRIYACHIGHTTNREAETTKVLMAKYMNDQPYQHAIRWEFCSGLMQFQLRNLRLENSFFVIDWNILLTVEHNFLLIFCQCFFIPIYSRLRQQLSHF